VIANELSLPTGAVAAVMRLTAEGATVPFIARYRKEATSGLDEVQIRAVVERGEYLRELETRRAAVLAEVERQGQLTAELRARFESVTSKAELEDLYQPYRPKRRTRAAIAVERGLERLAEAMWTQTGRAAPVEVARTYVVPQQGVADAAAALAGARDICAERLAEDPELRRRVRETCWQSGVIRVAKKKEHKSSVTKFDAYASFEERVGRLPPHRYLAIRRGENEGVLKASIQFEASSQAGFARARIPVRAGSPWQAQLNEVVLDALERLLGPAATSDVAAELKRRAEAAAIDMFAANLRELLLAAPLGGQTVLGIDPGQRTGCKCAVVDATGKFVEHATIFLVQGEAAQQSARQLVQTLCERHAVKAIAIGNGTHGRETLAFVRAALRDREDIVCVPVNEAGASVYSASSIARDEFPQLDLTVRGAISIARRLQDPLAELVKIEPKSIGVGQYQHDVPESQLEKRLDDVVESCVNAVGVELNTASEPLLARVAGIGPALAKRIVLRRHERGAFEARSALLDVPGVGPRTFEQAAGFLRIAGGRQPLDASAVHPERYRLVERMALDIGASVGSLIGNSALLTKIDPGRYRSEDVGDYTLTDILSELAKPGRDPRQTFEPPKFRDDVQQIEDLRPGMALEGVVTNITAFGAFVDVGVHQDGLVHISELADRFVSDPHQVVKVGDRLSVSVLHVDVQRRRIALSAKRRS
jgi:uncharacterized protein